MSDIEHSVSGPDGSALEHAKPRIVIARDHSIALRRWRLFGHIFGATSCLLFMIAGTVFGHFYWNSATFSDAIKRNAWSMAWKTITTGNAANVWTPDEKFPGKTSMNVLVLGVDHDYDNRDQIIRSARGRSDSILLARVDFVNHRIDALTIPRDTAVRIPGRSHISKINAAHNFGGPELTMETIKSVFGVDSDACVVINFEGFQQIVDALHGIDVDVQVPRGHKGLDYDDNWGNLHIHLKPGYQHLTGYQAMGFVRMRHSDSDEMRSKRQHEFLEAMRTKIKEPGTFLALPNVVDKLNDNLKRTNLTEDQLFTLVNFARNLPKENIHLETLPSYEGPSYVTVDTEKSAAVIQRIFFPNQYIALNIDAPDSGTVRSMNARYAPGAGRSRGAKHGKTEPKAGAAAAPEVGPPMPEEGLSVQPQSPGANPGLEEPKATQDKPEPTAEKKPGESTQNTQTSGG